MFKTGQNPGGQLGSPLGRSTAGLADCAIAALENNKSDKKIVFIFLILMLNEKKIQLLMNEDDYELHHKA